MPTVLLIPVNADDRPASYSLVRVDLVAQHARSETQALLVYVDDLSAALAQLKARGVRLVDETPRPGAHGTRVAFVHPSSTGGVLLELKERTSGPGDPA